MLTRATSRARKRALIISLAIAVMGLPAKAEPEDKAQSKVLDTSRIVSIGGDVTEIIYRLGAGDRIVAVDATSQFPTQALKTKQNVGYMRALSSEGVLSTRPSVIVASEGAGPPEVIKALKSATIPFVTVTGADTASGLREKVSQISSALGLDDEAKSIISQIDKKLAGLAEKRNAIAEPRSVLFILAARDGRAIVGGKGTSADAVIQLAGAKNAVSTINGFKPLTDEALIAASPDTIIVMKRGDGSKSYEEAAKLPGVRLTPAGKSKRVHVMDGVYLIGFGPRMPDAASDLMAKVYGPEATGLVKKDIN